MRSLVPDPGERVLPGASGVLLAAAFPPFHLLIPSFVGLVPLALWLLERPPGEAGERVAGKGGFLFGLTYFGLLFHWIASALVWFDLWALPAYFAVVLVLAWGASWTCRLAHRLHHHTPLPFWVAFGMAWTALEWARAHAPAELAFPWLGLGTSLTGYPELVGAAELVGARGLTLWLACASGLLATALHGLRTAGGSGALRLLTVWLFWIGPPMGWGVWRAGSLESVEVGRVAVVQSSIPEHLKLQIDEGIDSTFASGRRLLTSPAISGADLVAFPEMTFFGWVEIDEVLDGRVSGLLRDVDAPVLFGAIGHGPGSDAPPIPHNSAFLLVDGARTGFRYDKRRLVPMVERVPLLPPRWFGDADNHGGYGRGTELPLGETAAGGRFGVLICYESTYPSSARAYKRTGADFLVNITNDAWFGREPWYTRTGALWQHPAHLVMRAIENRIGIVRAANTGPSFFVDPLGRVEESTQMFVPAVASASLRTTREPTVYSRMGDVAGTGSALTVAILWSLVALRRRREASA